MRRLFIMRKDLNMSPGKLSVQIAHCAEAYWTDLFKENKITQETDNEYVINFSINKEVFDEYVKGIFTKTICEARNKTNLLKAREKALELGLIEDKDFGFIYDACLTELRPEEENGTCLTGMWFAPLDDEIIHKISKKYQLYKW